MSVITWLVESLQPSDTGYLKGEDIFHTFQISTAITDDENKPKNYLTFAKILHKVFPGADKRRKVHGQKITVFHLQWKNNLCDRSSCVQEFDPNKIIQSCPSNYIVLSSSLHSVKLSTDSGHMCNNTTIAKILTLKNDFTFTVSVRGVTIDLASISIKDTYSSTCQEIASVFEIVDRIQLCQGISFECCNYVRKNHILEEQLKIYDREAMRVLRSTKCKMVSSFVGRQQPNCKTCQTMTVHYENDVKDTDRPILNAEDTVRLLMPNASEQLVNLILSQVTNSANSRHNRWDQHIMSEFLNLYTRSPEGYRVLRQSGLLILPSPRLIILYKNSINHEPGFESAVFSSPEHECAQGELL